MVAPCKLVKLQDIDLSSYDEIIDVRTPHEYEDDRIPGAISLPVLNDEEHAVVGTMHKQVSSFDARKHGGSLVSTNIGQHLATHFKDKPKSYKPLLYCWRGGQRSNSFGLVLAQIGWPVDVIEGGYKAFRGVVRDELPELASKFSFRILVGLTGSGKTVVLSELEAQGEQILDLEGCANHQGSLLGQRPDEKVMNQKAFETVLWDKLKRLDPSKTVWVEGESSKIGRVFIPQPLFSGLCDSPSYELVVPRAARVKHIIKQYPHWTKDSAGLIKLLEHLKSRYGKEEINQWTAWAKADEWPTLVDRLLELHYDKSYLNSRGNLYGAPKAKFDLATVEPSHISGLVKTLKKV